LIVAHGIDGMAIQMVDAVAAREDIRAALPEQVVVSVVALDAIRGTVVDSVNQDAFGVAMSPQSVAAVATTQIIRSGLAAQYVVAPVAVDVVVACTTE
jgi:hypothetical protein